MAVLTNGGGPGILVADACEAAGLLVPELSEGTQAARCALACRPRQRRGAWWTSSPAPPPRSTGGRARPAGHVVTPPGIDPRRGRALVGRVLGARPGGRWADAAAAEELLAAYGIPTVASRRVRTPGEAAAAQAELGGPVAVKIAAAIHKSDVGGVALGIDSPQAAAEAVTAIRATLADAGIAEHAADFLVQEQLRDGVEMIVGVSHDPAFGPLVMVGLGGTTVEVLGDVALRITSLSDADVDEMLRSLRSYTGCSPGTAGPRRSTWLPSPNCCTGSAPWSRTSPRSPNSTSTRFSCASTAPSSPTCASASPGDRGRPHAVAPGCWSMSLVQTPVGSAQARRNGPPPVGRPAAARARTS